MVQRTLNPQHLTFPMAIEQLFTREQVLDAYSLRDYCIKIGVALTKKGEEYFGLCPIHNEKTPSFAINPAKGLWRCYGCQTSGSVVDLYAKVNGVTEKEAYKQMVEELEKRAGRTPGAARPTSQPAPQPSGPPSGKATIKATYDYTDETGKLLYQAVRLDPKSFRQRKPAPGGKWDWTLAGVQRVIYNLPKVLKTNLPVWIVEGEKDADNLNALGFTATTNVCGAGQWMEAYCFSLKGKHVVVCVDNDDAGDKHRGQIMALLADHAASIRSIKVPAQYKDVSNLIEDLGKEKAIEKLAELSDAAVALIGGIELPVYSIEECEAKYEQSLADARKHGVVDLAKWLPTLGHCIRPLVPGDLAVFLADTGVGKTGWLQNLALHAGVETLFCELEVVAPSIFERFVQITCSIPGKDVEENYHARTRPNWRADERLRKIHICDRGRLSVEDLEKIILKSELKIGNRPRLVIVDYLQLMAGKGESRYARFSNIAEGLKNVAKATNTVIFTASQVTRKQGHEVCLHDAKESGSIENSSGLMLGGWRDEDNARRMIIKVLKCTKGKTGARVNCDFNGELMQIRESSKIEESDMP